MGNMMDDAVGMLVGPEMVRTGEEGGAGGDVAVAATAVATAAAAAGNRASSSRAQAGVQGTVVGGLDDQAGAIHADEVSLSFYLVQEGEGERCRPKFVVLSSSAFLFLTTVE